MCNVNYYTFSLLFITIFPFSSLTMGPVPEREKSEVKHCVGEMPLIGEARAGYPVDSVHPEMRFQ